MTTGTLEHLRSDLKPTPLLYVQLMRNVASQFQEYF